MLGDAKMSDDNTIEKFVKKLTNIHEKKIDNVSEPNTLSKLMVVVQHYFVKVFSYSVKNQTYDHEWPLERNYNSVRKTFYLLPKVLNVVAHKDEKHFYLIVEYDSKPTDYKAMSFNSEEIPKFNGDKYDVSKICIIGNRIVTEVLNSCTDTGFRNMDEILTQLIESTLEINPPAEKRLKLQQLEENGPSVPNVNITNRLPKELTLKSKLLGIIMLIGEMGCELKLCCQENEWPIQSNYDCEIVTFTQGNRKFFLSLVGNDENLFLTARNTEQQLLDMCKIPCVLIPSLENNRFKIDNLKLSDISIWLINWLLELHKRYVKRVSRSSSRDSSSSSVDGKKELLQAFLSSIP